MNNVVHRLQRILHKLRLIPKEIVVNSLLFNLVWFACILGPAYVYVPSVIFFMLIHIFLLKYYSLHDSWLREFGWILACTCVGILIELLFVVSGVMVAESTGKPLYMPPLWLIGLWVSFASMLRISLNQLMAHWWLIGLFGAVGAPLSYWGGSQLSSEVDLAVPLEQSLIFVSGAWLFTMIVFAKFYSIIITRTGHRQAVKMRG